MFDLWLLLTLLSDKVTYTAVCGELKRRREHFWRIPKAQCDEPVRVNHKHNRTSCHNLVRNPTPGHNHN